jgi:hypothetical protein
VDAGIQQAIPQRRAAEQKRPQRHHAQRAVERDQQCPDDERGEQVTRRDRGGVHGGDQRDRAEVVDDRERDDEHLERRRHTRA